MTAPDPRAFASQQFASSEPFDESLDMVARFATDVPLVVNGLLEAASPQSAAWRFCEVGFGSGWLLEEYASRFPDAVSFGLDLSESLAQTVHAALPQLGIVRGDMEALPFGNKSLDCVASCCAIYFARDIERALRELARVARRRLVVNTVGPRNLRELDALSKRVLRDTPLEDMAFRFDMATGESAMAAIFGPVQRVDWHGTMRLPTVEHFTRYWSGFHHQDLRREGPELLARARGIATEFAARDGSVSLTRHSGAFIVDF